MRDERRPGTLRAQTPAGGGLVRVEIVPAPGFASTYQHAGQYVSAALAGKETYFALAGEPGAPVWEVLVRAGGEVVDALLALSPGEGVPLSPALGRGFPMDEAETRRLFVLATGSGVAAVRPVLRARVRGGLATATELFLGVRARSDLPLPHELDELRGAGLAVTVCCSRETPGAPGGLRFEPGYVQDALLRRVVAHPVEPKTAIVFAAGVATMVDRLREVARDLHLDEADIRTNY